MATPLLSILAQSVLAQSLSLAGGDFAIPAPTISNLGFALRGSVCQAERKDPRLGERWVALDVQEQNQGLADLNGDGDDLDTVLFVHDLVTGKATPVGALATCIQPFVHGEIVGFALSESANGGLDLNGDADDDDFVAHFYEPAKGQLHNQRVVVPNHGTIDRFSILDSGTLVVEMSEDMVVPLNADGDLNDAVLDAWFLGKSSGVFPPQRSIVRRTAGPRMATGLAATTSNSYWAADEHFMIVGVDEAYEGHRDLNGDGDAIDFDVLSLTDLATGVQHNLGIVGNLVQFSPGAIAFRAAEAFEGADLNGDGDQTDQVLHIYNPLTGAMTNIGLAVGLQLEWIDGHLVTVVSEAGQGQLDFNGDGDASDEVAIVLAPGTWSIQNLAVAGTFVVGNTKKAFIVVSEDGQGASLNGDADKNDFVLHSYDVATKKLTNLRTAITGAPLAGERFVLFRCYEFGQGADLNFDGDLVDAVVAAYDSVNDKFHNTGLAVFQVPIFAPRVNETDEGGFFVLVYENDQGMTDFNEDGDASDFVLHYWKAPGPFALNMGVAIFHDQNLTSHGGMALLEVSEPDQKQDLNGDGDMGDVVAHILRVP